MNGKYELIVAIVNHGFEEEVMSELVYQLICKM